MPKVHMPQVQERETEIKIKLIQAYKIKRCVYVSEDIKLCQ